MEPSPHILVVDDHRDIRDAVSKYLARNGLRVTPADGGAEMRAVLKTGAVDLVVLDVMMPGEDGLSLCRFLRETSEIPVIMLTAMAEDTDRVVGLELGADDYVTKPFNPRELLARIRAVLRRSHSGARPRDRIDPRRTRFNQWILDSARQEILQDGGAAIALSTAEFRLLQTFIQRPHVVLSRDQLLDLTAGRAAQVFDRSIDNQVSRLRRKIEEDPKNPSIIKTVWGGGYVFAADVEELP
ncbi:response regulator [Rhodoligotrophos appendicifer]|uniref:response regulator n=1 Tax=Rhodoligotrophos appendicifer TaxID=987056 RepID=UPI00118045FD|nr:response regulator [Rhodoligotrophos appendicifer]